MDLTHKSGAETWTVYYLVQPYFFAHAHLHRRKMEALCDAGINARVMAFVPQELLDQHREKYQEAMDTGTVEIVPVSSEAIIPRMAAWYLMRQLLKRRRVLVHVLRIDPTWLINLRCLPVIGKRLRIVLEFEGDQPEELLYQGASVYPYQELAAPDKSVQKAAEKLAVRQAQMVKRVDGLVLMSEYHVSLWRQRLSKLPPLAVVPSLHDSESAGFSPELRRIRREELGWHNKLVVIYTGNVICSWQRFPALCRFVARLQQYFPDVRLLALVRKDDLALAKQAIDEERIAAISQILSVPAAEVASYLCAADFGLFLRHRHPMNLVVTSAKLGEYLACGLPVITTGGNAEVLNCFIREANGGVFLPEDLSISDSSINEIKKLRGKSQTPEYRNLLADSFGTFFSGIRDPLVTYNNFITALIGIPDRQEMSLAKDNGVQ